MRFAVAAAVLGVLLQQPAPDAFVAQRDAAAARSPLSARFTIAFEGDRVFRPGEAIPLVFSYDGPVPSPFNYEHFAHLGLAKAVLDHSYGTVYPLADFDRAWPQMGGVLGGVPGCLIRGYLEMDADGNPLPRPPQTCPPVTFVVYLNQDVRFDEPGRYRFYVEDDHVSFLQRSDGKPQLPTLILNVLELEITQRDTAWEEETAGTAIRLLDAPHDYRTREEAARTLRFLGTDRAIDEMVRRVGRVSANDGDARQTYHFIKGLFGAADRGAVITRMEAALMDPKADVGGNFMLTLASLSLVRTPGAAFAKAQQSQRLRYYRQRRANAIKRIRR